MIDLFGVCSRYSAGGWWWDHVVCYKDTWYAAWTQSLVAVLFPRGWNSEVFGNQLMFSIYCPLYVPCNSPAPWAQLDRQTPKDTVSLGKAWPISFPSDVRTPLNCRVGLLHRHWFGMTVLQWWLLHCDLFWNQWKKAECHAEKLKLEATCLGRASTLYTCLKCLPSRHNLN